MDYGFSSVMIALIASNSILVILSLLLLEKKVFVSVGYRMILFGVGIAVLRMIIPLEFPFCHTMYFPQKVSYILSNFQKPFFLIGRYELSLWDFFQGIWFGGIIIVGLHMVGHYKGFRRYVLTYGKDITFVQGIQNGLKPIFEEKRKIESLRVYQVELINSPMIVGLFHPMILIPENMDIDSIEMRYVLKHEMNHYFYHDLWKKMFVNIVAVIYWWNPVCYLLKRQINILLEMYNDDKIVNGNESEKEKYLMCLLHLSKLSVDTTRPPQSGLHIYESKSILLKRFELLTSPKTYFHKGLLNGCLLLLMGSIYISSYCFTLESSYYPSELDNESFAPNVENSYFVEKGDGTYDLYYKGEYIDTVDSLDYYDKDIEIK